MNYGKIYPLDVGNGPGVRVTLFVSGCRNQCKNCFNQETWDFNYGQEFTNDTLENIIDRLNKPYIDGLTILGGEPLEPENQEELFKILSQVRERCPGKNIWMWTGFTYEELMLPQCRANTEHLDSILKLVDVLVDGRFVEELKNIRLKYCGSSNQRVIDIQSTLHFGVIIEIDTDSN